MLDSAKRRAREQNVPFTLTLDDVKIPTHWPVFNFPLVMGKGLGPKKDSPSLDRIDPSKGYVKDNIQVISWKANAMKTCANRTELIQFAKWILNDA